MSHPGYLHDPLQMFGPENELTIYVALGKIDGINSVDSSDSRFFAT